MILAGAVAALLINDDLTYVYVPFSLLTALCMPLFLIGPSSVRTGLSWAPLRYLGTRAYGVYLFHPMLLDVVDLVLPRDDSSPAMVLLRIAVLTGMSLVVA